MNTHFIVIAEAGDFIGEQKLIAQHLCGEMRGNQWHMLDGSVWDILVTGVGAINVMKTLRDIPRDAQLINIGIGYFDYKNKISPAKSDGGFSYIIKANRDGIIQI